MVRPSGALALLALLVCAGCKGRPSGTEDGDKPDVVVLVRTARVERQTVRELVEAAGTVVPSLGTEAQVAAQVAGTVVAVLKDEGQEVATGEPVLEIDASVLREEARQAEAEVRRAEADERLTREKLERAKSLFARGIAAAKDVAEAEATHTGALQALGRARAGDQVAQIHERRSVVRSPVQGTVLHRLVAPGQYVQPDTILFSVAPMAHLDLSAVVPASELARLRVGQEGELDCPGPDAVLPRGEVKLVAPALDPASGTATVRVAITNEARTLRPGMFCRVRLVADRHDSTLVVPVSAVTFKEAEQKGTVAVVDGDVARVKEVTTGIREGTRVEILDGLEEGDRVVSEGSYGLADGTKLRFQ